ncbi:MAG: ABC transporter ATP-binding protein [Phycisphaerales bacterium]
MGNLIEGFSFLAAPNEFVSFIGRTGVGKTTLLRIIAGLERRYVGQVTLDGVPVTKPSREIQIMFQDCRLLPWKTVYGNIEFAARRYDRPAQKERIEKWIGIVGLQAQREAWPKTLSGGETSRVAFVRAFVDQPKVLLLDEPFQGLDLMTKFDLQDRLAMSLEIQKATVVLISHSIEDAVFLSDSIYVLSGDRMSIERRFDVDVPRPRRRGDAGLLHLSTEIVEHLTSKGVPQKGHIPL